MKKPSPAILEKAFVNEDDKGMMLLYLLTKLVEPLLGRKGYICNLR